MNYKVKISKKFKDRLSKRFDFKKARKKKLIWGQELKEIDITCPLCEVFNKRDTFPPSSGGCRGCPFKKFATEQLGCYAWFNRVIPHRSFNVATSVWWKESEDNEVKEQLSLLRKKAKEIIEWV